MKRLYHLLALVALINLFAIGGLVGYLFASGRLNEERVNQIAMVLRGEFPTTQPAVETQPATVEAPPEPSQAEIARIQAQKEYYQLVAERHARELEDRRTLNEQIRLDVIRRLEEIEQARAEFAEQRKQLATTSQEDGFARTLEMFSTMDPKQAKELLKPPNMKEADAVRILREMDTARARKIIAACKGPDEIVWIGRILNQISKPQADLGAGVDGPKPSSAGG